MRYTGMNSKWEQLEGWRQKYTPDMNHNTHINTQPHSQAPVRVEDLFVLLFKRLLNVITSAQWLELLNSWTAQWLELLIKIILTQTSETGKSQFTNSKLEFTIFWCLS